MTDEERATYRRMQSDGPEPNCLFVFVALLVGAAMAVGLPLWAVLA